MIYDNEIKGIKSALRYVYMHLPPEGTKQYIDESHMNDDHILTSSSSSSSTTAPMSGDSSTSLPKITVIFIVKRHLLRFQVNESNMVCSYYANQ